MACVVCYVVRDTHCFIVYFVVCLYIGKVHPCIGTGALYRPYGPQGGVEVQLYSFLTTALEGGEGSASRPGRSLPPGKTWYSLHRRLGGTKGRSGQVRKISPPPGFDPRTVQHVASRYTDYATRPTMLCMLLFNFVYYMFLLLYMFCAVYCVSLCCSGYCLCVNVYCTTAAGCQPNCSQQNTSTSKLSCLVPSTLSVITLTRIT